MSYDIAILRGGLRHDLRLEVATGTPSIKVPTVESSAAAFKVKECDAKPKFGGPPATVKTHTYIRTKDRIADAVVYEYAG